VSGAVGTSSAEERRPHVCTCLSARARRRQPDRRGSRLLVPQIVADEAIGPEEARKTLELATPILEDAAGGPVTGLVGPPDALLAVERVLVHEHFDEVIISTLPERASAWLKRDLPAKVERLGVPVTVVRARTARRPIHMPAQFAGP
jgi:hypothetical protein